MSEATVTHAPDASQYEIEVDGKRVGRIVYRLEGDVIDLLHTEVDDGHDGEGLGGKLARGALEDARSRGLRVRPSCPFIAKWIGKHPKYADLVA